MCLISFSVAIGTLTICVAASSHLLQEAFLAFLLPWGTLCWLPCVWLLFTCLPSELLEGGGPAFHLIPGWPCGDNV